MGQEMCPAALVNVQRIQHLLFRSDRDLRTVEIETLLGLITLEPPKLPLVESPLIRDRLTAFKATYRDDHAVLV